MREYFEAEMRVLQEAAAEFSRAYPDQARMLDISELRDRDPYIERLLEGMAFLTARIRQEIQDSRAAVSEQLLAHVCPNQLTPFPSTTVMAFVPAAHGGTPRCLPAGAEIKSRPVLAEEVADPEDGGGGRDTLKRGEGEAGAEGIRCVFRTATDTWVQGVAVREASACEVSGTRTVISVEFQCVGSALAADLSLAHLPLYLHADQSLALALYLALCNGAVTVRVRGDGGLDTVVGGQDCLRGMHLEPETSLLPVTDRSHPGFSLLQEYFCCRDKFLFVELSGLDRVSWPDGCRRFTVEMTCDETLPAEHKLSADNLRLHCVPAVNLFAAQSEPVNVDHKRSEYRIVADRRFPGGVVIHSVDDVQSRGFATGETQRYEPLYNLRQGSPEKAYYDVIRRDIGTGFAQIYVALGGPRMDRASLSCDITASNGHLPRRFLHESQITECGKGMPGDLKAENITRPSAALPAPGREDYAWRLHALLSLNVGSMARASTLRALLSLFDWSGRRDNARRIEGIAEVAAWPVNRIVQGILYRGLEIEITVTEERFLSPGDIYLFGQVIHRFFALSAAVNEFIATRLVCLPSQREFSWFPRLGRSSPI